MIDREYNLHMGYNSRSNLSELINLEEKTGDFYTARNNFTRTENSLNEYIRRQRKREDINIRSPSSSQNWNVNPPSEKTGNNLGVGAEKNKKIFSAFEWVKHESDALREELSGLLGLRKKANSSKNQSTAKSGEQKDEQKDETRNISEQELSQKVQDKLLALRKKIGKGTEEQARKRTEINTENAAKKYRYELVADRDENPNAVPLYCESFSAESTEERPSVTSSDGITSGREGERESLSAEKEKPSVFGPDGQEQQTKSEPATGNPMTFSETTNVVSLGKVLATYVDPTCLEYNECTYSCEIYCAGQHTSVLPPPRCFVGSVGGAFPKEGNGKKKANKASKKKANKFEEIEFDAFAMARQRQHLQYTGRDAQQIEDQLFLRSLYNSLYAVPGILRIVSTSAESVDSEGESGRKEESVEFLEKYNKMERALVKWKRKYLDITYWLASRNTLQQSLQGLLAHGHRTHFPLDLVEPELLMLSLEQPCFSRVVQQFAGTTAVTEDQWTNFEYEVPGGTRSKNGVT